MEGVRSEDTGVSRGHTIWKQDVADPLDPADEHLQLLRVPHVVTQFVELLEVTVCTC
jgi:hypothetical protein